MSLFLNTNEETGCVRESDAGSEVTAAGTKPGPACSKGRGGSATEVTAGPSRAGSMASIELSSTDEEFEGTKRRRRRVRACQAANAAKKVILSTSGSEVDVKNVMEKRRRGRPVVDPSYEGKFTAAPLAKRAAMQAARKLEEDHRAIIDPEIWPSSNPAVKAKKRAEALSESYDREPINAVAAVMSQGLAMIAKSVERSGNIQGPIVGDLWDAYAKITACTSSLLGRKQPREIADLHQEAEQRLRDAKEEWRREKDDLQHELSLLQARNARLKARAKALANRPEQLAPSAAGKSALPVETGTDLDR